LDIEIIDEGPTNNNDALMMEVIKSGQVDALERMIALREREDARQAALEFDRHFSVMQSEFGSASRNKQGYKFRYAPIESLQLEFGPTIAKHGFSYSWSETQIEGGKRVTMTISGYGSSRVNSFDVPALSGTDRMNEIQVAGAQSTYGRRYSFISGFGIIIADEDTDGDAVLNVDEFAKVAEQITESASLDALAKIWKNIYPSVEGKPAALRYLVGVKDAMKEKLS